MTNLNISITKIKILVTGGCGFIGSYVVDNLISSGYEVYVFDIKDTFINNEATYYIADITDDILINSLFERIKPAFCIHLAGILGTTETWEYPNETVRVNIQGSNNIFNACGKNNCNIITVDVGSRWLSPYTISKTCAAEFALGYANKYNIKCALLRIFNVYGPRQSTKIIKIAPMFIYKALNNNILEIWGNKYLDLIYVTDVAEAFVNCIPNIDKIDKRRDIYIGSGKQMLTSEFAEIIINKIKKGKINIIKERLGEENIDSGFMNNTKSQELLNWKPIINIDNGIDETIEYYKKTNIENNFGNF
jgi:UDP-glucose 4-epimerase